MNEFTDHIKILIYFILSLLTVFIVAFSLKWSDIWFSTLIAIIILVFLIVKLARDDNEIGKTN